MEPKDFLRSDYLRAMAVEYGKHFIGTPYLWGGDDFSGFDCSGFVVEILQAVGILPHCEDYSANDLYEIFRPGTVALGYAGCLAFWFDGLRSAVHVMLLVDNAHVIGASGGGSATTSLENAMRQNAFVKMRPLNYRKGTPVIVDPFRKILE